MNEPTRFINKKRLRYEKLKNKDFGENDVNQRGCKSVDLDEIFEFSAARQRALERNAHIEYLLPLRNFLKNRVFINHVDSFNGKIIADVMHHSMFTGKYYYAIQDYLTTRESFRKSYLSEQTIDVLRSNSLFKNDEEYLDHNFLELSEEEVAETEKDKESRKKTTRQNFEIIGTVDFRKNPDYLRPESVNEIIDEENKNDFLTKLFTCGYIIYDISNTLCCHPVQIEEASCVLNSIVNQLEDLQKYAPKLFKKYNECRTFILISTVMTCAKSKPIDPEDPTLPFTERDYRKRKPHPNYKIHYDFEKRVIEMGKKFPDKFRTIIISSGITYGFEEDVLHFLFKMAWLNEPELPIFKPGNNKIPLLHVKTLAKIVHLIIVNFPNNIKYIFAVEQDVISQEDVVKLISKKMGTGKCVTINKEEVFLYHDMKQRDFDMLTINLNIIPGYILNNMELKFNSELTFKENIDTVILEFKTARNLMPIKIFIHGPPASGKSLLSKRLVDYYNIHHLHAKRVIEEGIQQIKDIIEESKRKSKKSTRDELGLSQNETDDEMLDDEDGDRTEYDSEDIESLTQFLNAIKESMSSNEKNRLDERLVLQLFKRMMLSNSCQNQGFVIDGYPKTINDCRILYEPDEEGGKHYDEDKVEQDVSKFYNKKIMPDYVVSLDASDEFLIQRVIKMPQRAVQDSHYVEDEMCRRLVEYRTFNSEENTLLIFFDELDIYPTIYNIEYEAETDMNNIFQSIIKRVGPPRNYDLSQYLNNQRREKEEFNEKCLEEMKLKSHQMAQERRDKMENWIFLKNQEKEMEEKALALMAMPLRHYLMKYIFPTLTRGLVEVARVRPGDPVDYLAEFLFKENPEGKMFQPNYEALEEELTRAVKEYDTPLDGHVHDFEGLKLNRFSTDESILEDVASRMSNIKTKTSTMSVELSDRTEYTKKSSLKKCSSSSCKCLPILSVKNSTASTVSSLLSPSKPNTYSPFHSNRSSTSSLTVNESLDKGSQYNNDICKYNLQNR